MFDVYGANVLVFLAFSSFQQGRLVLLNGLIKQDVSLNHTDSSNYFFTPLIAASANGREECVRVILQCPGVQVSVRRYS